MQTKLYLKRMKTKWNKKRKEETMTTLKCIISDKLVSKIYP